jgi:hypothetical protein
MHGHNNVGFEDALPARRAVDYVIQQRNESAFVSDMRALQRSCQSEPVVIGNSVNGFGSKSADHGGAANQSHDRWLIDHHPLTFDSRSYFVGTQIYANFLA